MRFGLIHRIMTDALAALTSRTKDRARAGLPVFRTRSMASSGFPLRYRPAALLRRTGGGII